MERSIEIVTIHYNTPDLLLKLYKSIRKHLGDILFRVIDGSELNNERSNCDQIVKLSHLDKNFIFERLGYNIHHGNGMHYAIEKSEKDYILILDSDCEVLSSELIDKMFSFVDDETYAVGKIYKMLRNGEHTDNYNDFILYLHPKSMLLNRRKYYDYLFFKNHGSPCIYAMRDINDKKDFYILKNFQDINNYVIEKGRGTVERFGYGLRKQSRRIVPFSKDRLMFNILIRTSGRPNYYKNCLNSVFAQTYGNYKIIVSYDDEETFKYVKKSNVANYVRVIRKEITNPRQAKFDEVIGRRRLYAPYNMYFNEMVHLCDPNGFVIFLDDDNMFFDTKALFNIYLNIKNENDLLFWRVQFPDRLVPNDSAWMKRPQCCNIDSGGFSFHMKHWTNWDEWTMGDFKVASILYDKIPNKVFINKVFTKLQRKVANGLGRRDDL